MGLERVSGWGLRGLVVVQQRIFRLSGYPYGKAGVLPVPNEHSVPRTVHVPWECIVPVR